MNVLQVLHWESYLLTGEFTTVSWFRYWWMLMNMDSLQGLIMCFLSHAAWHCRGVSAVGKTKLQVCEPPWMLVSRCRCKTCSVSWSPNSTGWFNCSKKDVSIYSFHSQDRMSDVLDVLNHDVLGQASQWQKVSGWVWMDAEIWTVMNPCSNCTDYCFLGTYSSTSCFWCQKPGSSCTCLWSWTSMAAPRTMFWNQWCFFLLYILAKPVFTVYMWSHGTKHASLA